MVLRNELRGIYNLPTPHNYSTGPLLFQNNPLQHQSLFPVRPSRRNSFSLPKFQGQFPATAELRNEYLADFYLNISDIFKNNKITAIINFTNRTKRFIEPEEMD